MMDRDAVRAGMVVYRIVCRRRRTSQGFVRGVYKVVRSRVVVCYTLTALMKRKMRMSGFYDGSRNMTINARWTYDAMFATKEEAQAALRKNEKLDPGYAKHHVYE